MEQAEFDQLKKTFPWTERIVATKTCGLVQVIDCNGAEVPLFTITRFLQMITSKLATKEAAKETANEQTV